MRLHIEPFPQIGIDRGQIHPVIEWEQNARNNEVADKKPDYHHIIFKAAVWIFATQKLPDRSRNRDKSHARKRCPDHPKRHQPPFTFLVSDKKRLVVGVTTRKIRDDQKPNKIGKNK